MKAKRRRRLRDQNIKKRLRQVAEFDPELAAELQQEPGRLNKNDVGDFVHSFRKPRERKEKNNGSY